MGIGAGKDSEVRSWGLYNLGSDLERMLFYVDQLEKSYLARPTMARCSKSPSSRRAVLGGWRALETLNYSQGRY